jgi:predicted transcriptional regulator
MNKAVKKIKKIKAELDKLEAKEETLFEDLDEAIDELEDSLDD